MQLKVTRFYKVNMIIKNWFTDSITEIMAGFTGQKQEISLGWTIGDFEISMVVNSLDYKNSEQVLEKIDELAQNSIKEITDEYNKKYGARFWIDIKPDRVDVEPVTE